MGTLHRWRPAERDRKSRIASGDFQFFDLEEFTFSDFVIACRLQRLLRKTWYFSDNPAHPALYMMSIAGMAAQG